MSIFKDTLPPEAFEALARRVRALAGRLQSEYCDDEDICAAAGFLFSLEDIYMDEAKKRAEGRDLGVFEEKFKDSTAFQMRHAAETVRADLENRSRPGALTRIVCVASVFECLCREYAKRLEEQEAKEAAEAEKK